MEVFTTRLDQVDRSHVALVGSKAANLGELTRVDGIRVPAGFCVTTEAFGRFVRRVPSLSGLLERLSKLRESERSDIAACCMEIRAAIEAVDVPDEVAAAIIDSLGALDGHAGCAVRSSATSEDSSTASFAGQHDTSLNVIGPDEILRHVRGCWASLFTARAATYRLRNGLDHHQVRMAVVVQRMLVPRSSGVVFTADPVTSDRTVSVVEAVVGLGEALVSGSARADVFTVRDGAIVATSVATKQRAVCASPDGGTQEVPIDRELCDRPALTVAQVTRLAELGRRIEAHFGQPQDIEWCLVDDELWFVQSRPITTLFPIPEVDDDENHVYVSVGHQQMMTDPMKPLGLSFWQLTTPAPMAVAGGRLFVDVTRRLAAPQSRADVLDALGRSDPLIRDALDAVIARGNFLPDIADAPGGGAVGHTDPHELIDADDAIVTELVSRCETSIATMQRAIATKSGADLVAFIVDDIAELKRFLFDPRSSQVIRTGMEARWWLDDHLHTWLGETGAADALAQSVPGNVTSEMGLALLDVADVIRQKPDVVAFLAAVEGDPFLDALAEVAGGDEARDAFEAFLERFGMRCPGEIDITRPRWSERPSMLISAVLGYVEHTEPGSGALRFARGRQASIRKEAELLERLRALPDGERKAAETKEMIDRLRAFTGFREHPKYGMVSRYFVYKRALMAEADRLVQAGVLRDAQDIAYLTVDELRDVVRTRRVDDDLIGRRKREFDSYRTLSPPRVLTSDGERLAGSYRRGDLPADALAGLAVSAGTVEGRARVVHDPADAALEPGDILVTAFTDPSWTTLFVAVVGLVTEVGGRMTHGAVIAREYGLPAVVGVEHATTRIRDGQRIRVDGTAGTVELLDEAR